MTDLYARIREMIRKIVISIVALLLSFSALAQSEKLYLDTSFNFDFDNTEYSGSGLGAAETLFGVALAPVLRLEWNDKHNLGVGVNAQKMFGSVRFLDNIDLVAYYQFKGEKYGALAGLFRRENLLGRYSEAFFSNAWFVNNRVVQGLALQYHDKIGFAELVAAEYNRLTGNAAWNCRMEYSNNPIYGDGYRMVKKWHQQGKWREVYRRLDLINKRKMPPELK